MTTWSNDPTPIARLAVASSYLSNATDADDPLDMLMYLAYAKTALENATTTTVYAARAQLATWEHIGRELGMSKQAAQQKYGDGSLASAEATRQALKAEQRKADAEGLADYFTKAIYGPPEPNLWTLIQQATAEGQITG